MTTEKNSSDNKENFVTYQVGDKYYIKYDGQDEKEISRQVFFTFERIKTKRI